MIQLVLLGDQNWSFQIPITVDSALLRHVGCVSFCPNKAVVPIWNLKNEDINLLEKLIFIFLLLQWYTLNTYLSKYTHIKNNI